MFDSSPPPPLESLAECCPRPSQTAQDGDQHLSPFPAPRKRIGGLGGRGSGGSSQIHKVGREKRPNHSGVGCCGAQGSRLRSRRVSWCSRRRTKKPQGRHGLGGFHDATLGLAGLNVEKDQHENPWQTLTFRVHC